MVSHFSLVVVVAGCCVLVSLTVYALSSCTAPSSLWETFQEEEDVAVDMSRARVYTADQNSNTVSVIDPAKNVLLGLIRLGNPRPDILNPLYKGEINVHGLGFAPNGKHLCVVSHGTHSVNLIETKSNKVVARKFVGMAPHECFFTADSKEVWVAVRGEDYLSVLDATPVPPKRKNRKFGTLVEKARVDTIPGPGMVIFSSDGKYAYANNSFHSVLQMIDVRRRKVIKTLHGLKSPFSPFLFFSPNEKNIWLTHKDQGYVTRIANVTDPKKIHVAETIKTGLVTNHLAVLLKQPHGREFVYVTVGGEDVVKVYKVGSPSTLADTIEVPARPHGVWSNAPRRGAPATRLYVGAENSDSVTVIDVNTNRVIAVIPIGQAPQALIYVPNAVPKHPGGDEKGTSNLSALPRNKRSVSFLLYPPGGDQSLGFVGIRHSESVKMLTVNAFALAPTAGYTVYLKTAAPQPAAIAQFTTSKSGMGHVETVGPPALWNPASLKNWTVSVVREGDDPLLPRNVVLESRAPNPYAASVSPKAHAV